jgi:hypothetical protein
MVTRQSFNVLSKMCASVLCLVCEGVFKAIFLLLGNKHKLIINRKTKLYWVCGSVHLPSLKQNTQLDATINRKILLLCRTDTAQHVFIRVYISCLFSINEFRVCGSVHLQSLK